MKNSIFLFFLFLSTIGIASPNESARQYYAGRMYNAFLIQSIGETRMAYRVFKGAYQDAQNAGESPRKLEIMNDMFIWYRTYGWSCGVSIRPSFCEDEWRPNHYFSKRLNQISGPGQVNYQREWQKEDPEKAKHVRNYFIGLGEFMAGLFCVVNFPTPVGLFVGGSLGSDGIARIINSFNDGWETRQKRILEMKALEQKAQSALNN
jgi:hypothetical protein